MCSLNYHKGKKIGAQCHVILLLAECQVTFIPDKPSKIHCNFFLCVLKAFIASRKLLLSKQYVVRQKFLAVFRDIRSSYIQHSALCCLNFPTLNVFMKSCVSCCSKGPVYYRHNFLPSPAKLHLWSRCVRELSGAATSTLQGSMQL